MDIWRREADIFASAADTATDPTTKQALWMRAAKSFEKATNTDVFIFARDTEVDLRTKQTLWTNTAKSWQAATEVWQKAALKENALMCEINAIMHAINALKCEISASSVQEDLLRTTAEMFEAATDAENLWRFKALQTTDNADKQPLDYGLIDYLIQLMQGEVHKICKAVAEASDKAGLEGDVARCEIKAL